MQSLLVRRKILRLYCEGWDGYVRLWDGSGLRWVARETQDIASLLAGAM